MKNKPFIPILLTLFLLTACEEQMVLVPEPEPPDSDRKVLIEEFTGANCSACPGGAAAIQDLIAIYGENVVAVSIHSNAAGLLGEPLPDAKYDLRTPFGDDIAAFLAPLTSIPAAAINRKLFPDQSRLAIVPFTAWKGYVEEELNTAPSVQINTTTSYNADTRELNVKTTLVPQQEVTGDLRIGAYLIESHIIDRQLDGTNIVEEYEHNHVLRHRFVVSENGVQGEILPTPLTIGTTIEHNFPSFTLPTEPQGLWVPANCHVVTFVARFDAETGNREILQADEVYIAD